LGAGRIDGCGIAGRPGPDDDQFAHLVGGH